MVSPAQKTLEQKFRSGDVLRIVLLLVSVSLFSVCECVPHDAAMCVRIQNLVLNGTTTTDVLGVEKGSSPLGYPPENQSLKALLCSLSIVRRSLWIVVSGRILSWADI